MAGCSFLVLEGVDGVRGNALRCSPSGQERRGMRCAVPRGRRGAALSPAADRGKGAALFSAYAVYAPTIEKPPTGRFFWIVRIGSLLGGFSLTKAMHKLGKLHKVQLRVAQNKSKILQKV